jgi:hypothetical protein
VTLPAGVTVGQAYRVISHQLSARHQRVEGTFELFIPVKPTSEIIERDRSRLSVFRHIFSTMSPTDRRHAIFVRRLVQIENRLRVLGVDPSTIAPSSDGEGGKARWASGVAYRIGQEVVHLGLDYRCRQAHTSQLGWEPPLTYALWERIHAGSVWAPQVNYPAGTEVTFGGQRYRAIQGHQSQPDWEPPSVPALWAPIN